MPDETGGPDLAEAVVAAIDMADPHRLRAGDLAVAGSVLAHYKRQGQTEIHNALATHVDGFASTLHNELQNAIASNSIRSNVGAVSVRDVADALERVKKSWASGGLATLLAFALALLSLAASAWFTLRSVESASRPEHGMSIVVLLVGLGLFTGLMWIRGLMRR